MKKELYSVLLNDNFRRTFLNNAILKFKNQTTLAKYLDSKIKQKKIKRENIKEWLKGKHHFGWDILIPIDVLKELCEINSFKLNNALENAIKFNPPWEDPNKKKKLVSAIKSNPKLIKRSDETYLDIATILPETTLNSVRSGKKLPLFTEIKKDKIKLWSEANWKKSSIILNRFVKLNDIFFIGSAIYAAEGTTKQGKYNTNISIGNSEPSIIKLFLQWLNSFMKIDRYSVKIEFNGKKCDKEVLIQFWKQEIPLIKNKKLVVRMRPKSGSRLINNKGILNIKIDNTVLKPFIINLIKCSQNIVFLEELYALAYLRGLLASEGSITRPKLREVTIGCMNIKERKFIKKLLKKLDLKFTEGKNQFSITGWNSFLFIYLNNILNIPQINGISKKEIFNKGFKNHQTTKGILKLNSFRNKEFTAKDWQKEFNLKRYISAHKFLNKFTENKVLITKFDKNIKFYSINSKKLGFLKRIWAVNNL